MLLHHTIHIPILVDCGSVQMDDSVGHEVCQGGTVHPMSYGGSKKSEGLVKELLLAG